MEGENESRDGTGRYSGYRTAGGSSPPPVAGIRWGPPSCRRLREPVRRSPLVRRRQANMWRIRMRVTIDDRRGGSGGRERETADERVPVRSSSSFIRGEVGGRSRAWWPKPGMVAGAWWHEAWWHEAWWHKAWWPKPGGRGRPDVYVYAHVYAHGHAHGCMCMRMHACACACMSCACHVHV